MSIGYSAEDTIDLPVEYQQKWGINLLHFHIEKGGEQFRADEISLPECWEFTKSTGNLCHTSAVNIDEAEKHFAKLKESHEKIIHFTISSGLSSGYQNACAAANGDPDIYVFDSRFTSGTIAMYVLFAQQWEKEGKSFEEICSLLEEKKKAFQGSMFIGTTYYLYKGGRCSKLAAIGATLLKIRPIIVPDKDGKFTVGKKYIGPYARCLNNYIKDLLNSHRPIDKTRCFYNYSSIDPKILEDVLKQLKEFGFQEIYSFPVNVINGYHAGPEANGLMFFYAD
ncbi:MAG: DegV family protein [Bacillota bacterium]|nr:DegV family protein [Bacillota bacterium]